MSDTPISEAPIGDINPGRISTPSIEQLLLRHPRNWKRMALNLLAPLAGAAFGLFCGAIIIWLSGADPWAAYGALFQGAFGGGRQISETLLKAVPLILMGLGLTVAFRCRVWNIGGEGQYFMGAVGGAVIGLAFQGSLPSIILIPLMVVGGIVGGALWAGVAAWLKVRFAINEIISTLMLNYIAEYTVLYLVRVPLKDSQSFLPQSAQLIGAARMPTLGDTRIHIGILIALIMVPLVYLLLWHTPLGFQIRAIGSNQSAARYAGMPVTRGIVFVLMFSGALAGMAGTIEVSSLYTRLKGGIGAGYGFTGILVALLGRLHPVGVVVAALFFSALTIGVESMHSLYGLPIALAQVIQALVVLFVLVADALAQRIWR